MIDCRKGKPYKMRRWNRWGKYVSVYSQRFPRSDFCLRKIEQAMELNEIW